MKRNDESEIQRAKRVTRHKVSVRIQAYTGFSCVCVCMCVLKRMTTSMKVSGRREVESSQRRSKLKANCTLPNTKWMGDGPFGSRKNKSDELHYNTSFSLSLSL